MDRGFVGASFLTGRDHERAVAGFAAEAGVRIPNTSLWGRVSGVAASLVGAFGSSASESGTVRRIIAGLELRRCSSLGMCSMVAAEGGYYFERLVSGDRATPFYGPLFGARAGLDVGGARVRLRIALGLLEVFRHQTTISGGAFEIAVDVTAGVGVRI
jgi:hypothetical protein